MGFFKRLCLFLFGLAGLLALTALVLPWYGPWTREATALLGVDEYYMTVEALVLVTALGCLITLLYSIFKRNRKMVIVAKTEGDQITVARDAIASQARHVIEEDGTFRAKRVNVSAKKRGHVRVYARIQPQVTVDVVSEGQDLHDRLVKGLTTVCGDNVDSVDLEFLNAAEYQPASDYDSSAYEADSEASGYAASVVASDSDGAEVVSNAGPVDEKNVQAGADTQAEAESSAAEAEPVQPVAQDADVTGSEAGDDVDADDTGEGAAESASDSAAESTAETDSPAAAPSTGSEITVPIRHHSAADDAADKE